MAKTKPLIGGAIGVLLAYTEDTGLVTYLNAQTRAQVEAYKKSLQARATPGPEQSSHTGTGSLGIYG